MDWLITFWFCQCELRFFVFMTVLFVRSQPFIYHYCLTAALFAFHSGTTDYTRCTIDELLFIRFVAFGN
ncbi:hypothetical protein T05_5213 [Trichinella murrelli]|uniref:Uncharacterized protein n=1 Tax=Trichinella murrelli TaxID=144512 RepID=A0A0V0TM90_9BILA|nr:hypothetical protein T05_5213 [Trichinella murrelli]